MDASDPATESARTQDLPEGLEPVSSPEEEQISKSKGESKDNAKGNDVSKNAVPDLSQESSFASQTNSEDRNKEKRRSPSISLEDAERILSQYTPFPPEELGPLTAEEIAMLDSSGESSNNAVDVNKTNQKDANAEVNNSAEDNMPQNSENNSSEQSETSTNTTQESSDALEAPESGVDTETDKSVTEIQNDSSKRKEPDTDDTNDAEKSAETENVSKTPLENNKVNDTPTEKDTNKKQSKNNFTEVEEFANDEEKTEFVHVNSKSDKPSVDSENQDETIETEDRNNDEDPIGTETEAMDFETTETPRNETETNDSQIEDSEMITGDKAPDNSSKDEDADMCIIPDTERVISQEEKDAAKAMAPLNKETEKIKESTKESPLKESSNEKEDSPDKESVKENADENIEPKKSSVNLAEKEGTEIRASLKAKEEAVKTIQESMDVDTDRADDSPALSTEDDSVEKDNLIVMSDSSEQTCHQCCLIKPCKYSVSLDGKQRYICQDACLKNFRNEHPDKYMLAAKSSGLKFRVFRSKKKEVEPLVFVRKCSECRKIIVGDERNLSWECMEFCNEDCLSKFQNTIGSHCANCKESVPLPSLGKYCVRFGYDIRQFCSSSCLEEFKKGLKVCSYCQKDISGGYEGFLAPVGDKGQFKDFCTQSCMEKYDLMSNNQTPKKELGECAVCNKDKPISLEIDFGDKTHKLCSEPCFVAFKFVNNVTPEQCSMCLKYFERKTLDYTIFYDDAQHNFCCKTCQNVYIIANRKIVPCQWCKVKKYNFDMIKKNCTSGQVIMMCSINCFALYQVSVNAVSSRKIRCDNCGSMSQAQYHLTMSDATIRNFCSYQCVMTFQSQFAKSPITITKADKVAPASKVVPTSAPKRNYGSRQTRSSTADPKTFPIPAAGQMPIISNVHSLAQTNGPSTRSSKAQSPAPVPQVAPPPPPPPPQIKTQFKHYIVTKPQPLPEQKNKSTMCRPNTHTKGVSCRPHPCQKETQTDESLAKTVIVPVPVPIYVPTPVAMYSMPFPVPVPIPLPVPIPIFIPTTRNSANGIMKEIKKIQVKIPTDPFEAELLMMAEMVAGEKKVENTDSESDEDDNGGSPGGDGFSPVPVDTSNTFGDDDMLQMALNMATELDEPAVDLEGALTANTITASQTHEQAGTDEGVDESQQMQHHAMMEGRGGAARGGRKRQSRQSSGRASSNKRSRRMSGHQDMPMMPPPQPTAPPPPPEPVEKPDANMCLKYTFGVNAWKQWVTTKNAELEKSSRRVKLFKPEILQLTSDELNYSLCLFVKEVRKPNGSEYAPDTIYYLCLGIQQYLFENGRIDNIFTDPYYEKFTECLDEVARKFSVLYNDSHYIVTRVEEEHLWESKQLGAHSPHVLLSTLMFFNTKHFNLTTVDEHMQLSFSHIMKHWKRNPNQPGAAKTPGSRNVLLRFYPPQSSLEGNARKKKVYEQQENEENPLRCPVKLYEFYLSKCPESVKTRNDVFYLLPERSCVPDSPVWYSTMALGREALEKMLHRVKMVKEINVALLTS